MNLFFFGRYKCDFSYSLFSPVNTTTTQFSLSVFGTETVKNQLGNEASDLVLIRSEEGREIERSWSDSWNRGDEVLHICERNKESHDTERRRCRKRIGKGYDDDDGCGYNCRRILRSPDFPPDGASGGVGTRDRVTVSLREDRDLGARISYSLLLVG